MFIVSVHLVTKCSAAPSWPAEPRGRGRDCTRVTHSQPQRGVQLQAGPRRPRGQHGGQLGGQLCGGGGPGGEQEPLARPAPGVVAPPLPRPDPAPRPPPHPARGAAPPPVHLPLALTQVRSSRKYILSVNKISQKYINQ